MFRQGLNVDAALAMPEGMALPLADIRTRLNERAFRGWSESSRHFARVATLAASDVVAGLLGIVTILRTWSLVSNGGLRPLPDEVPLIAMVFCLQPLALQAARAYDGGRAKTDVLKVVAGVTIAAFLGWVQAQLFGRPGVDLPNKTAYVYAAFVIAAYAWTFRLAIDAVVGAAYRAGWLQRRVVVVGRPDEVDDLLQSAASSPGEVRVVGLVLPGESGRGDADPSWTANEHRVPIVGDADHLEDALSRAGAQGVILASNLAIGRFENVITACFRLGATVSILPAGLKRVSGIQLEVRETTLGSFLQLRPLQLALPQLAVKRTLDVVLTAIGLLLLLPFLLAIAVAVKLDSRGPVLFRQTRLGVGGRRFEMLKFRTMVVGADAQKSTLRHLSEYADPRLFKIKCDPRVTRLGRFLRRMSLDEFPQLWNVLRGDMSLVGPRPCVPEEFAEYLPHHMERLFVLPGVTGPWQVNGRNKIKDFEEVVRLDSDYIRSWSLATDLLILLRTIPTLFRGGAY